MKQVENQLQRILDAHRLPCGAVIAASGEVVARAGDFAAFASAGLVSAMLGPYGSAEATFGMVQNPELVKPIIWGQASEFAFLCSAGELVVVVFGRNRGDAKAQYELSRLVNQTVVSEFARGET